MNKQQLFFTLLNAKQGTKQSDLICFGIEADRLACTNGKIQLHTNKLWLAFTSSLHARRDLAQLWPKRRMEIDIEE